MSEVDYSLARTALHGRAAPAGLAVELSEAPLRGMVSLRGDLSDSALTEAVRSVIGVEAPERRKAVLDGQRGALWMAPDELLLYTPYREAEAAVRLLGADLAGRHHLALNVSDARAILRLRGHGAREVIAKGAPVDLSRGAFGVGDLRRSRIAQTAAAFYQVEENPDLFEVICFRSHARHVFDWLAASAAAGAMPGAL